ncbi:hypothetical protein BIY45_01070 [Stenotrophomonas sp. BIIR7]|nr:hypothetical protein BIY45_01070 [Stenotrophomonas sp. BIIR7]
MPDFAQAFEQLQRVVHGLPDDLAARAKDFGFPHLHRACVNGDLELVKALLAAGIGPDLYPCTEDEDDETPLVWLAQSEDMTIELKIQVSELLLAHGASVDEGDPVEHALEVGDDAFAEFLKANGAGVE